jgi:CRP-like cAMP-binding protein
MRPAEKLAHLLMELHWRIEAAGLANGRQIPLPITRETIGDALGLSTRKVNKAMVQLKRRNLLKPGLGRVDLADPARLHRVAVFTAPDPEAYAAAALAYT